MPPPPRQNAQATRLSKPRQARAPQVLPVVFGALGQALGAPKTHEAAQFTGHLAGGNELGGLGNELELEIFERVTRGETGMHQSDVLFFGGGELVDMCFVSVFHGRQRSAQLGNQLDFVAYKATVSKLSDGFVPIILHAPMISSG